MPRYYLLLSLAKNPDNAGNCRPIALTSHLCKWLEKVIVRRLSYYLEQRGMISAHQNGFHKGSTIDALVKCDNEAEKAISTKEVMIVVYFDIEKAYDSMWRERLMIKLYKTLSSLNAIETKRGDLLKEISMILLRIQSFVGFQRMLVWRAMRKQI